MFAGPFAVCVFCCLCVIGWLVGRLFLFVCLFVGWCAGLSVVVFVGVCVFVFVGCFFF